MVWWPLNSQRFVASANDSIWPSICQREVVVHVSYPTHNLMGCCGTWTENFNPGELHMYRAHNITANKSGHTRAKCRITVLIV